MSVYKDSFYSKYLSDLIPRGEAPKHVSFPIRSPINSAYALTTCRDLEHQCFMLFFFLMPSFKASRSVSVFYFTDTFHSINAYHVLTGSSVLLGMQRARLDSGWVSNEECDSWSLQGQVITAIVNNFFLHQQLPRPSLRPYISFYASPCS